LTGPPVARRVLISIFKLNPISEASLLDKGEALVDFLGD
jgi:hypothetical protein